MSSLPPSSYFSPRPKKNENRQHSDESNASSSSVGDSSLAKPQASEDSFIAASSQRGLTGTSTHAISSRKQQSSASRGVARSGDVPSSTASSDYHCSSVEVSRHLHPSKLSDKATAVSSVDTTPRSKRSKPIAIELPSSAIAARKKSLPVCTPDCEPLSARGDLVGGYFPFHENQGEDAPASEQSYKPHPFDSTRQKAKDSFAGSEYQTSNSATMPSSSRDATPRAPFPDPSLSIPLGKYHPSNYKITPTTSASTTPTTSSPSPLLPGNLQMPSSSRQHSSKSPRHHKRNPSDIKRKLQQYQRDMVQQAQTAAWSSTSSSGRGSTMPVGLVAKPVSPRLLPMGSPDELSAAMTPLELGDGIGGSEGYLGARSLGTASGGGSRESEMVGRMIRMDEERRRREGQSSPIGRV